MKQFHVKQQWKVHNNTNQEGSNWFVNQEGGIQFANQEGSNRFVNQEGAFGLPTGKAAFGLPTWKSTHTDNLENASSAPLRRVTISKAREEETKRGGERACQSAHLEGQQEQHGQRLSPAAKS